MTAGKLLLVTRSPRVATSLLSAAAWSVLSSAPRVLAVQGDPLLPYLAEVGITPELLPVVDAESLARIVLTTVDSDRDVVFLVPPDAEEFTRTLATLLFDGSGSSAPVVEVVPGSFDLPGARVLDLVAIMDRLRSPGGCPWDSDQTHQSLTTYLLEETYETLEAIETGNREHLREELGDLLLQVVFHSRIAAEDDRDPWSVDDVAADIVDKLVRRHPHVFGPAGDAVTAEDVEASWHTRKAAEKGRASAVEGVPLALPALSLAAKLMQRAAFQGVPVPAADDDSLGSRLMLLVAEALTSGLDAEAELRATARRYAARVRDLEA